MNIFSCSTASYFYRTISASSICNLMLFISSNSKEMFLSQNTCQTQLCLQDDRELWQVERMCVPLAESDFLFF